MVKAFKILFVLIVGMSMMACSSYDCSLYNQTMVCLKFTVGDKNSILTDTLSISTRRSDGSDTLLINRIVKQDSTSFPMSYKQDEDVFYLDMTDTTGLKYRDTVWVSKTNEMHFESVDCEASYFHTIQEVRSTHKTIDKIIINNKEINYDAGKPHLIIHFFEHE